MLVLPVTVHIPSAHELPHREDIEELLAKRKRANITQGFITRPNKTLQLPFVFYADININNNRLWQLFTALAGDMPAEVLCFYGLYEDEPVTTNYLPKQDVLKTLSSFEKELTMDCLLEFGLRYHTKEMLTEIFVTESKYIKFCGSDKARLLQHMRDLNLNEVHDLAFIDEYPKTVRPLKHFIPTARRPEDVIWSLNRAFGVEG